MLRVGGRTFERTAGSDLLVGFLATGLSAIVYFAAETVAESRTLPHEAMLVRVAAIPFIVLVSVPLLVGIYARSGWDEADGNETPTYDRRMGGLRETTRLTVDTLRDCGVTLLAGLAIAIGASLAVGLLAILALHAVVFGLLTIAGFVSYALGSGQLLDPVTTFRISGFLTGLGIVIGVVSVRCFDCVVCWTDAGPYEAVRESLRFTRVSPATLAGYAVLSGLVLAVPLISALAVLTLTSKTVAIGAFFLVASWSVAVYANFHAQVCSERLLPVCCDTTAGDTASGGPEPTTYSISGGALLANPGAVVLALVIVIALLVGSGYIRALDVRPVDSPEEPGPIEDLDDVPASVSPEMMPVSSASVHITETTYTFNTSQDRWVKSSELTYQKDRVDRQYFHSLTSFNDSGHPETTWASYWSTKQWARTVSDHQNPRVPSEVSTDRAWYIRTAGNWVVYSVAGTELANESAPVSIRDGFFDQDWEVKESTGETITLVSTGDSAVPITDWYESRNETAVEVTLDRESGFVTTIVQEVHVDNEEYPEQSPFRLRITFEDWNDHDVGRPADIDDIRTEEWIWAIATY